jgi:glycosyltransferase involved in cell wall biosynthesis
VNKKKINIIIVGVSYYSPGASSMRVRNLFTPLTMREDISIKNLIITTHGMEDQIINKSENGNIYFKNISYNLFNIFSVFIFIINCFLTIKQMKLKGNDNILYVYGYPDLEKILLIIFSKLFNYKIIFDVIEDNFTIKDYKSIKSRIKNYPSLLFIKKLSFFADGAIAISSHIKEQLDIFSKKQIPVMLIPISVDFSNFNSIKATNNDDIKLFYGGSFGEQEDIELLLDAFETVSRSFKNVKIVMTGNGAKRHMDKFYKLIAINSSNEKIIFKGFLPLKDYYHTLNDCDIMCVIRNNSAFANGGFPFKLGEYLASGKAVIVSDVSDIHYYLKDKINAILIRPGSKDDLVQAIETLITNRDLRIKIGEEGRKAAKKYFDNHSVAQNFLSFIENRLLNQLGEK